MKKWNVMIADDEFFIRQRIKKIIPWDELSLNFIGEAENGQEVLSLLAKVKTDILLLDIKMPKLTGIDIAGYIKQTYPQTKTVILTGYNDFEYARTALRCGVIDYLLKPVNNDDLIRTLESCIRQLKEDSALQQQQQILSRYENTVELQRILNNELTYQEFAACHSEFTDYHYTCFISAFFYENTFSQLTALQQLLDQPNIYQVTYQLTEKEHLIQLFFRTPDEHQPLAELIQRFLLRRLDSFIVLGKPFPVTTPWKQHYRNSISHTRLRYFYTLPHLLTEIPTENKNIRQSDFQFIRQTVNTHFNNQNEAEFLAYLDTLLEQLAASKNLRLLTFSVNELFLTCELYISRNQLSSSSTAETDLSFLEEEATLTALKQAISAYASLCLAPEKALPSAVGVSKKIIHYIEENYTDPDLSISHIAAMMELNVSYMGSLFKKVHGKSISQFLIALRMKAAKQLLEQGDKRIFEIAEQVGYIDVFYFSRRFKQTYGCSPKEYAGRFASTREST